MPHLTYPVFDPVALHLGPLEIRWYALAYIAAILRSEERRVGKEC